ncbi:cyclophilin-like protein, partial [Auriculariales sp. MPI-PUGE-AT-0066]
MSVLLETSLGDLVFDLDTEHCPKACENFLKLCKVYYYNLNAFFNVARDFLAQTGDPYATGKGGESVWSLIASGKGDVPRYFEPERGPALKHTELGTLSMACSPDGGCGSQFFVTLAPNIDYLDGVHAPFGRLVEGEDTLAKINEAFTAADGRPLQDIRIRHTIILDDPYPDPSGLVVPAEPPSKPKDDPSAIAIREDEDALAEISAEEEALRKAAASALTLEMVGDLPFANVRPPENVLFVCKLNPATRDEDLELIFSRFGTIISCQVIRDKKTGDSLQYAFIEFDRREDAEQAYFKMQNVLIDDRRIWVDFSQSVARTNGPAGWSNNPSRGGGSGRGRGGRPDYGHSSRGGGYGMVFDDEDLHRSGDRERRAAAARAETMTVGETVTATTATEDATTIFTRIVTDSATEGVAAVTVTAIVNVVA